MFIELLSGFLGHRPGARLDVSDADAFIAAGKVEAAHHVGCLLSNTSSA